MTSSEIERLVKRLRDEGATEVEISSAGDIKVKFEPRAPSIQFVPVAYPSCPAPPRRYRWGPPEYWLSETTMPKPETIWCSSTTKLQG